MTRHAPINLPMILLNIFDVSRHVDLFVLSCIFEPLSTTLLPVQGIYQGSSQ